MSILCCLVHLGRVLWLWQEGWEETERAFTACTWHVCDEAAASTPAEPPPCTSEPEWAESTDGHAHTQILYTSTDTGDISDMGYSIYRRHWLDRMHLIIGVFLTPGGSQCRSSELSSVGEEPSNYSVLWECLYIALESLFCLRII